jgi:hypothetical protein
MVYFIVFLIFVCFIVICFQSGWYILGTILSLIPIIIIIAIVIQIPKAKKEEAARQKRNQELKAKREEDLKTIIIPAYNQSRTELINRYGNPTKVFILEQYNLNKEIIAFEESKRIWICGNDFPMKSILSCTFADDQKVVKGQITSTTKTNTGNMVKRAVVGEVLIGGAGAIIGGSTASKTTISTQENDKVVHNYTIIVNVDSLSEPIIRVHIGTDGKTVNEIVGLMNVIINRR